jgi:LPS sulfotransferase NodH
MRIRYESFKDYKGFAQEAVLYSTYLFKPKRKPLKKFVVFSCPRTGSTLLVTLLDSHPQIHCQSELWLYRMAFPKLYLQCQTNLAQQEVYGFKLQVNHFQLQRIKKPDQFMAQLCDSGFKIIKLGRRNLFRTALSLVYAKSTGKYVIKKDEKGNRPREIVINPQELLANLQLVEQYKTLLDQISSKLPHIEFVYEDDLTSQDRQQATVDQISEYLGIPSAKVSSDLVKGSSDDFSDFVANADEVRAFIRTTRYAEFLDM